MKIRKNYKVSVQDGKKWVFAYLATSDFVTAEVDYDGVCQLHIGATTMEFEGEDIEVEEVK